MWFGWIKYIIIAVDWMVLPERLFKEHFILLHAFFISNNLISNTRLKLAKKIKQKLSNTLRLNVCHLKIIHFLHSCYHPKLCEMFKKCVKKKCVCFNDIIWLIIMKMRLKMKIGSHRYDINRTRPRHEHKYTKYEICLSMIMVIFNKKHLSNICWVNGKVKQHWGWVEKKCCF